MAKKPARIDRRINVILLESNKHLWEKYEVVKVKAIFAKNVLFAKGLAVLADKDALFGYKAKMESATKNKAKKAESYSSVFDKIAQDNGLVFMMKANEKGVLYEKIDPTHIANQIKTVYGVEVEEHFFKMKKKITQTGEYTIPFQYNNIEKDMQIIIKAEDLKKVSEEATIS
jgi:ribosomal protein L9